MTEQNDATFTASIPALYDRCLGPLLFEPYALDLAERAKALGSRRILEVAAGTGIVSRALAAALPEAEIEATDLNADMVAHATLRSPAGLRWSTADAQKLPFEDGRFDLIVCQFGVMFFPQRVRAFTEARRVLRPGGRFIFNVWSGLEHNRIARILSETVEAAFPADPPLFIRRTPHGHGDPAPIERDLRAAGFDAVDWAVIEKLSRSESARDVAIGFIEGTPLRHELIRRDPTSLAAIVDASTATLKTAFAGDRIEAPMRAVVFTAS